MAHFRPRSQSRELMAEKREIAHQLLARGLTVAQITAQLSCSPAFVRKARRDLRAGSE